MILAVGVNGTGKTTTVGKLAHRLEGTRALGAARRRRTRSARPRSSSCKNGASARACRSSRKQPGADPAAVVHDALVAARARNIDVVLADTAGRLHTRGRSHGRAREDQARRRAVRCDRAARECCSCSTRAKARTRSRRRERFHERLGVTGLAITKLDGTAKGGILLAIARELRVPIRFVALGERLDDLDEFRAAEFVRALIGERAA